MKKKRLRLVKIFARLMQTISVYKNIMQKKKNKRTEGLDSVLLCPSSSEDHHLHQNH